MRLSRRNFLGAAALLPLAGCGRRGNLDPALLGHVAPPAGGPPDAAAHTRRGMGLALKGLNADDDERDVVVLHADGRGDPDRSRSEAVRLVTVNRVVGLLGGADAAVADALAAAVQAYSVALLTPAAIAGAGSRDGVFSLDVGPAFRGDALARFAAGELKAGRAAVVVDAARPVCVAIASAFGGRWRGAGGGAVQTWNLDPDADKLAARLKAAKPDVLVFAGAAAGFARLRAAVGDAPPKGFVFAGEEAEWGRLLADADAAKDVHAAAVHAADHFTDAGKEFAAAYEKGHGEPPDVFARQGYELVRVMAGALGEGRAGVAARVREELGKDRTFDGLTGPLTFDAGHARRPLYVVKAGSAAAVKEYNRGDNDR